MKPLRFAQISDFHWTFAPTNPLTLFPKRIIGTLNWLFNRRANFSHAPLAQLPPLFAKLGVDRVLLGGDFTSTASHREFEAARQFVERLEMPWIAIPGNHD